MNGSIDAADEAEESPASTLLSKVMEAKPIGGRGQKYTIRKMILERHPLEQFDDDWRGPPPEARDPEFIAQEALNHLLKLKEEFRLTETAAESKQRLNDIHEALGSASWYLNKLKSMSCSSPVAGQPIRFVDRNLLSHIYENAPKELAADLFNYFAPGASSDEDHQRWPELREDAGLDLPELLKLGELLEEISDRFALAASVINDPGRQKNTVWSLRSGGFTFVAVHTIWHLFRILGRYPSITPRRGFRDAIFYVTSGSYSGARNAFRDYRAKREALWEAQHALRARFDTEIYPFIDSWPAEIRRMAAPHVAAYPVEQGRVPPGLALVQETMFKTWVHTNIDHYIFRRPVPFTWGETEPSGLRDWYYGLYRFCFGLKAVPWPELAD